MPQGIADATFWREVTENRLRYLALTAAASLTLTPDAVNRGMQSQTATQSQATALHDFCLILARLVPVVLAAACFAEEAAPAQNQNTGEPNALQGFSQNRDQPVKIEGPPRWKCATRTRPRSFSGNVRSRRAT